MSRKVKICTLSFGSGFSENNLKQQRFQKITKLCESASTDNPDIFLLPEACLTGLGRQVLFDNQSFTNEDDEFFTSLSKLAKEHNAYVAAPVLFSNSNSKSNSVLVFDRLGKHVFTYNKAYLTPIELEAGLVSGSKTPECFCSEFGNISFAICFDLNFRSLFEHYQRQKAELLLFPSYFPGGRILSNISFDFSCFAVSSHAQGFESVFTDNYGRELSRANMFTPALTKTLELDSAVLPISENIDKLNHVKKKYGDAVEFEIYRPEGRMVFICRNDKKVTSEIIAEFDLVTIQDFLEKSANNNKQT